MAEICDGRIVAVTGAGRGIGRQHALEFARQGARLVVNDNGAEVDGTGRDASMAEGVVEEIKALGGEAVANAADVADWQGAQHLINQAIDTYGGLDVLVCNAGILRDRVLANMGEEEWDEVIRVHQKGTFAPSHHAAAYWRQRSKSGEANDARIICTSSTSGLFGNPGQANYGAAKAAIAAFVVIAARELERYGVTVNGVSPAALTRMTDGLPGMGSQSDLKEREFHPMDPANISPIVVWLGSRASKDVTGRLFLITGGRLSVLEGWRRGPTHSEKGRLDPTTLGPIVTDLLAKAEEPSTMTS